MICILADQDLAQMTQSRPATLIAGGQHFVMPIRVIRQWTTAVLARRSIITEFGCRLRLIRGGFADLVVLCEGQVELLKAF